MADILDDEILELEGLFASDNSSMRNRHIEFARRDYVKLRLLGYVRAPSELKLNEYFWVDVLSYLQPRTQVERRLRKTWKLEYCSIPMDCGHMGFL